MYRQFQETNSYWDDTLVDAIRTPLRIVIWVIGISYAISIVQAEKAATIFAAVGPLRDVGAIGGIAWFLVRFITRCEASYLKHKSGAGEEIDQTTAHAIAQLLRLSVIITAALVGLQTLGYKVSDVLAFGGNRRYCCWLRREGFFANFFGGHDSPRSAVQCWRLGAIAGQKHRRYRGENRLAVDGSANLG